MLLLAMLFLYKGMGLLSQDNAEMLAAINELSASLF